MPSRKISWFWIGNVLYKTVQKYEKKAPFSHVEKCRNYFKSHLFQELKTPWFTWWLYDTKMTPRNQFFVCRVLINVKFCGNIKIFWEFLVCDRIKYPDENKWVNQFTLLWLDWIKTLGFLRDIYHMLMMLGMFLARKWGFPTIIISIWSLKQEEMVWFLVHCVTLRIASDCKSMY